MIEPLRRRVVTAGLLAAVALAATATAAGAQDTLVSVGSPIGPFSQNKQNEPAVAIDADHPNVVAAGSNDEIDMEACNAGPDDDCPFTPGVGVSGHLLLAHVRVELDPADLHRPDRPRLPRRGRATAIPSARPRAGRSARCRTTTPPASSPTATRRWPSGPKPGANGAFSWANGSRLYYANLASACRAPRRSRAPRPSPSPTPTTSGATLERRRPIASAQQSGGAVLRQGADLGRQRGVEPRSSATSTSATPASAGTARASRTSRSRS